MGCQERIIRAARPDEVEAISNSAIRSKAVWAYAEEEMKVFRPELIISPQHVLNSHAHLMEQGAQLLGFYSLAEIGAAVGELEHIFVDPDHLGRGVGRALFGRACSTVPDRVRSSLGATLMPPASTMPSVLNSSAK